MKQQVRECMSELAVDRQSATAQLCFPSDFPGFQGHFPGNPILPGVCLILAGQVLAEEALGDKLSLTSLKRAKFLSPVGVDDTIQISCSLGDGKAKVSVTRGEERVSEYTLTFANGGDR